VEKKKKFCRGVYIDQKKDLRAKGIFCEKKNRVKNSGHFDWKGVENRKRFKMLKKREGASKGVEQGN